MGVDNEALVDAPGVGRARFGSTCLEGVEPAPAHQRGHGGEQRGRASPAGAGRDRGQALPVVRGLGLQSTPGEYSKLVEGFYEAIKKAGWKLESKGNLSQGGSNVEAFKLTGSKNELVIGYWLLANNQSQLYWCRLG